MKEITAEDLMQIVLGLSEERAALVVASLNPAMAWAMRWVMVGFDWLFTRLMLWDD
jgi:hypothetical protein